MIISTEDILALIPQRPPFVMIDELTGCDDERSRTKLQVKQDNALVFNGHLSEAGLLENIAQTAAAGVGYIAQQRHEPVKTGYIGAIKNLRVLALPAVGDVIETEVVLEDNVFGTALMSGVVKCNGVLLATCQMKIFINN